MSAPEIMHPIMHEYPLVVDLIVGSKKLLFSDWEKTDGEVLIEFPLTDEQITAIQERKSSTVASMADRDKTPVILDFKNDLILEIEHNQLILGDMRYPAHEDLYTVLLSLPLTDDQARIIRDAYARAEMYRLTHDEQDNLIIPQVVQPELAQVGC